MERARKQEQSANGREYQTKIGDVTLMHHLVNRTSNRLWMWKKNSFYVPNRGFYFQFSFLTFANSKQNKRGKTTEEYCFCHLQNTSKWNVCPLKRRQMEITYCLYRADWISCLRHTRFDWDQSRAKMISHCFFFWIEEYMPSMGFTQSSDDDEKIWCSVLKVVLFAVFSKSIKTLCWWCGSHFFAVFLLCILIISHFIFMVSITCQQVTNHHTMHWNVDFVCANGIHAIPTYTAFDSQSAQKNKPSSKL